MWVTDMEMELVNTRILQGLMMGNDKAVEYHLMSSWDEYFDSVMWLGAMPTFRPWKARKYRSYKKGSGMIRAHSPSPSSPSSVRNSSLISTALAATTLVPVLISMLAAQPDNLVRDPQRVLVRTRVGIRRVLQLGLRLCVHQRPLPVCPPRRQQQRP